MNEITTMSKMNMDEMLEKLTQTSLQNAEATGVIISRINQIETIVGGFGGRLGEVESKSKIIEDRVEQLELKEEITTEQAESIREAVNSRINELLHSDSDEWAKYSRCFYARLYGDLKKTHVMGSKIDRTRKMDYQKCLDLIEAWFPAKGTAALKKEIDEKAMKNKKAKEKGYVA